MGKGFSRSLITNLKLFFQNSRWRSQYGRLVSPDVFKELLFATFLLVLAKNFKTRKVIEIFFYMEYIILQPPYLGVKTTPKYP